MRSDDLPDGLRQLPRSKEEQLARLTVLYDTIRRGFDVLGWAEGYRGSGEREQLEIRITVAARHFRGAYELLFPGDPTTPAGRPSLAPRSDRPHRSDRGGGRGGRRSGGGGPGQRGRD